MRVRGLMIAAVTLLGLGCGLQERSDFLIGRQCNPTSSSSCDPGQTCLPHAIVEGDYDEFRCRDVLSFEPTGAQEAPLAFCDEEVGHRCPGDLVCNADRIRLDGGFRRRVCKRADDPFAPPLDAGPSW